MDLQDPPEVGFQLYEKCKNGAIDFVRGVRKKEKEKTYLRFLRPTYSTK